MSNRKNNQTIFGAAYEKFAIAAPVAVMVRGAIERVLNPATVDRIFADARHTQYHRRLLFSAVLKVFSEVVLNVHRSVHSSYTAHAAEVGVSAAAFYDKLAGTDPEVAAALVRHSGQEFGAVLEQMGGAFAAPLLPGWPVRILDGNCPAATQRRLQPLRAVQDRPLPGKAMVVLDPERMLILDALPWEDGHASERALIQPVLAWVRPGEVWIADRNLCFWAFILGILEANAYFVLRQHGQFQPEPLTEFRVVGRNASGLVSEQQVRGRGPNGEPTVWRRIRVQLDQPTRDGQREVFVITNLPAEAADALQVAALYLGRWTIERVFQDIEASLASEIDTLAYPRAALLALSIGFVAYNVLALVKGALRAAHGAERVEREISFYYLSEELENTHRGLDIAVPPETWEQFRLMSPRQLARELVRLAHHMDLRRYRKHPRGPKKPPPPRRRLGAGGNVSTARLLLGTAVKQCSP